MAHGGTAEDVAWHLLDQWLQETGSRWIWLLAERADGALRQMGVVPAQRGRILRALLDQMDTRYAPDDAGDPAPSALVRVWIAVPGADPAEGPRAPEGPTGWGTFVVHRRDPGTSGRGGTPVRRLDVFLYREGPDAKGRSV